MAFPNGVRTRIVTCGAPWPSISSNDNLELQLRVSLSSSRSLIWDGEQIEQMTSPTGQKPSMIAVEIKREA